MHFLVVASTSLCANRTKRNTGNNSESFEQTTLTFRSLPKLSNGPKYCSSNSENMDDESASQSSQKKGAVPRPKTRDYEPEFQLRKRAVNMDRDHNASRNMIYKALRKLNGQPDDPVFNMSAAAWKAQYRPNPPANPAVPAIPANRLIRRSRQAP